MEYRITTQMTPNPNAIKFVLNTPLVLQGKLIYKNTQDCRSNILAKKILETSGVKEIYFQENYLTVTQEGLVDWETLEKQIKKILMENIASHNPDIDSTPSADKPASPGSALAEINRILDADIRPFLHRDGGDVQVVEVKDNIITISYQGACGGCPGARFGTLRAIEGVLRENFRPDVVVQLAENK
jgi:NFU1 iron-sulfur cluster scaffold homolog, mitochondrial